MKNSNLYLKTVSHEEAAARFDEALKGLGAPTFDSISVVDALGRVTSEAVFAQICSPLYNCAAMDGVGVAAKITAQASQTSPIALRLGTDCVVVDTGDPIHPPFDAVIMHEDLLETEDKNIVMILNSAAPWQHIRPIGEDIVAGEMLLPGNHKIRPADIGVLLSGGITAINVIKRPFVAIIPTGTEIIEPGADIKEGAIVESNSRMLEGLVRECGGIGRRFAIVPDDKEKLRNAVLEGVKTCDLVLINAGSSAGTEDYTVHILRELGQVIVHGVAIRPGKPVILAVVSGKPVIGIPGYPVSAYLAFELFAKPLIARMSGETQINRQVMQAVIARRIVSSLKYKEFIRIKAGMVAGRLVAAPLARGAGAAMSLVRSDGFCVIEQNCEGVEAGESVSLILDKPMHEIENTVVSVGSHDLILDLIADFLPNFFPGMSLSSTHVGSMAGLMALRRNETTLAPMHLLDEDSGEYNVSYLKSMFPENSMALIKGVGRVQGILVKKGNPLEIMGIEDLTRVRYVNRQRGAGTRLLFDHLLKRNGISSVQINGYEREAATHMAVAAAVLSDSADAGMGILSAAHAMKLDFFPVGNEEYDFAVRRCDLNLPIVKAFITVLQSAKLKDKVSHLGGYTTERCGEIVFV